MASREKLECLEELFKVKQDARAKEQELEKKIALYEQQIELL